MYLLQLNRLQVPASGQTHFLHKFAATSAQLAAALQSPPTAFANLQCKRRPPASRSPLNQPTSPRRALNPLNDNSARSTPSSCPNAWRIIIFRLIFARFSHRHLRLCLRLLLRLSSSSFVFVCVFMTFSFVALPNAKKWQLILSVLHLMGPTLGSTASRGCRGGRGWPRVAGRLQGVLCTRLCIPLLCQLRLVRSCSCRYLINFN